MSKEELTKTTFRLSKSLLKEVQQYGLDHDMTDTDIFNEALRDYLSKHKSKEKSKAVER